MNELETLIGKHQILAMNEKGFAIADTLKLATKACRKATRKNPTSLSIVPQGATIDSSGVITYPLEAKFKATFL